MGKVIRLTESDLTKLVKKVIMEYYHGSELVVLKTRIKTEELVSIVKTIKSIFETI